MTTISRLNQKPHVPVDESLIGLVSMVKIFITGNDWFYFSVSDADIDSDGKKDPSITNYDPTHQNQTSIDPSGSWFNSNKLNGFVLPLGLARPYRKKAARRGGISLGCLGTILYKDRHCHAIFFDEGPAAKYGEISLAAARALGEERVVNGKIKDYGIEPPVGIIIYPNTNIGKTPVIQAQINEACEPLFQKVMAFLNTGE